MVLASGGVIMALEILSSRVLAPHFGSSVYVWGSIISVFLAALSAGYWLGGRLADRQPSLPALGRLLMLAAACQVVLVFFGPRMAGVLGALTGGTPAGTLVATTALFGPVSVLLATVSPYAIRLAARDLDYLGNTAGRLFALSTFGSLAGTLGCTFVLIPLLPLRPAMALLAALTAVTSLAALSTDLRRQGGWVAGTLVLTLAAVLGGARQPALPGGVVESRITPYQTLEVRESGSTRFLISDRVPHSAIDLASGEPALAYATAAATALLYRQDVDSMLVLGMGGGLAGRYLQRRLPRLEVDYVDIDPAIPEVASRWLGFEAGAASRVHVADARRFLAASEQTWDYIYVDVYVGLSIPFHLTTLEFFGAVADHLEPRGLLGINLAAGLDDPFARAILATTARSFPAVRVFAVRGSGNHLVLAGAPVAGRSRQDLMRRAASLDRRWSFQPSLSMLASAAIERQIELAEAPILTDAYAPVDSLIPLGTSRSVEELLGRELEAAATTGVER